MRSWACHKVLDVDSKLVDMAAPSTFVVQREGVEHHIGAL